MGNSHGSAGLAVDSGRRSTQPKGLTAAAWAAATGVAGFVLSILLGAGATIVTFNPDEGATFIAIWFWLAGPPVSALTMAAVARWRHWDPPRVWPSAAITFAVCLGCGIFTISTRVPPPIPPDPSSVRPPVSSLLGDGQQAK